MICFTSVFRYKPNSFLKMATHYKKLPTNDVDVVIGMDFKTSFQYESDMEIRKKYRSIYKYSDFDADKEIVHDIGKIFT